MQQSLRCRLLALAVLLLGACTATDAQDTLTAAEEPTAEAPTAEAPTTGAPTTGTAPLSQLTASLDQGRMDVVSGQLSVRLTNRSPSVVTVHGASLESTGFAEPMAYDRTGIVVDPGRTVDLRVSLSEVVCGEAPLKHEVHLDVELDDGRAGTVVIPAVDETGRIADLHAGECFAADAEDIAQLSVVGPPEVRDLGGEAVADLVVRVTPQGGAGSLELVRVRNTTLLQLVDPDSGERQPDGHPVAVTVSGSDPVTEVVLTVVPARCDAHAVADDKQGTRFRFDVLLDGEGGTVGVAAPAEVTAALYDFVQEACGS